MVIKRSALLVAMSAMAATSVAQAADGANTVGMASFYGKEHVGRKTASGRRFDMDEMTAAHRTLPFGTRMHVVNLKNGRGVTVEIVDRGPFKAGRIVDVSYAAAEKLGFVADGITRVRLEKPEIQGPILVRTRAAF